MHMRSFRFTIQNINPIQSTTLTLTPKIQNLQCCVFFYLFWTFKRIDAVGINQLNLYHIGTFVCVPLHPQTYKDGPLVDHLCLLALSKNTAAVLVWPSYSLSTADWQVQLNVRASNQLHFAPYITDLNANLSLWTSWYKIHFLDLSVFLFFFVW